MRTVQRAVLEELQKHQRWIHNDRYRLDGHDIGIKDLEIFQELARRIDWLREKRTTETEKRINEEIRLLKEKTQ